MSGRHSFDELTEDFTPVRRARVDTCKAVLRAAMPLHEMRRAQAKAQKAAVEEGLNLPVPTQNQGRIRGPRSKLG